MSHPKIISVEGNIGAGKTTIIDNLEKYYENDSSVIFIREPVDIWQSITDSKGESIFHLCIHTYFIKPLFAIPTIECVTQLDVFKFDK